MLPRVSSPFPFILLFIYPSSSNHIPVRTWKTKTEEYERPGPKGWKGWDKGEYNERRPSERNIPTLDYNFIILVPFCLLSLYTLCHSPLSRYASLSSSVYPKREMIERGTKGNEEEGRRNHWERSDSLDISFWILLSRFSRVSLFTMVYPFPQPCFSLYCEGCGDKIRMNHGKQTAATRESKAKNIIIKAAVWIRGRRRRLSK